MEQKNFRATEKTAYRKRKNAPCPEKENAVSGQDALSIPMHGEKVSDILGSYTGNPKYDDTPVQDADDLK
ncbi:MAG: hypothetical protein IKT57_00055 [Clostridia bacterium]|nr:hypothetical protein [Clostridia bacterium]